MVRTLFFGIAAAIASSALAEEPAARDHLVVPPRIHDYALSQNCVPPSNFYSMMPHVGGAPFAYGIHRDNYHGSFAVYCKEPDQRYFTLLFNFGGAEGGPADCADRIRDIPHPGELGIRDPDSWGTQTLQSVFGHVEPGEQPQVPEGSDPIPDRVITSATTLDTATFYLCYQGRWITGGYH